MLRQNYLWMWQEKYERASNVSLQMNGLVEKPQQASLSLGQRDNLRGLLA